VENKLKIENAIKENPETEDNNDKKHNIIFHEWRGADQDKISDNRRIKEDGFRDE